MTNPLQEDEELRAFMSILGFWWDGFQSEWRNNGRKQFDRDYDDSMNMDLAKRLKAHSEKATLEARIDELKSLEHDYRMFHAGMYVVPVGSFKSRITNLQSQLNNRGKGDL